MPMQSYLQPGNGGKQIWQMLWSNFTRGNHPYNFTGMCMAMVVQWLLELRFRGAATPEALARHLLQANLGTHGYGGLSGSQAVYGNENDIAMIQRHSGGALTGQNLATVYSANAHWGLIRSRVYNVPNDSSIRLNDRSTNYMGLIGISGRNSVFLRPVMGRAWAHAVGIYSDPHHLYILDPNYGVFVFDQSRQGVISSFMTVMWTQYGVTEGELLDVV